MIHSASIPTLGLNFYAGDDGQLVVWDLRTGKELQAISCAFHGPISCIAWILGGESEAPSFVFGCADGSIQIYQRLSNTWGVGHCFAWHVRVNLGFYFNFKIEELVHSELTSGT